jgi:hypothetical protein
MSTFKYLCALLLGCFFINLASGQSYKAFVDAVEREETNNPYIETFANELINTTTAGA